MIFLQRKIEMYKVLIENRYCDKSGDFKVLESEFILENFLDYYYNNIIFDLDNIIANEENTATETSKEKINSEDIEDNTIEEIAAGVIFTESSEELKMDFKKIDDVKKKICYFTKSADKEVENDSILRKVTLNYIKYNKKVNVVNKNTLKSEFQKRKDQGDLEKQHYLIKTFNNNRALLVWEKVLGSVNIKMIEKNLNNIFSIWVEKEFKNNEKKLKDLKKYSVRIHSIPSKKFLDEISNLDKISLLQVQVEKEKLTGDEDLIFSEENISRDVIEITYKPEKGHSFSKSKVKDYIENNIRKISVKKIFLKGRKEGRWLTLNTEFMQVSEYVDVKEDENGLIDSEAIFEKLSMFINNDENLISENIYIADDDEEE